MTAALLLMVMTCMTPAVLAQTTRRPPAAGRKQTPTPPPQSQPAASAPVLPPGFVIRTLDTHEAVPREYVVFVPLHYSKARAWPVLIFLHGSGESGTNNQRHIQVGIGPYIAAHRLNDFPFITIFPQMPAVPNVIGGFAGKQGEWVWQMLDAVQKEFHVDADRVYMTGLSMGGFGTWDLAMQHPDRLAAIAPICGGTQELASPANLTNMPIWAFHGAQDNRVPAASTRSLVEAVRKVGGKPKYTEYPDLLHNCWDKTYANPELYTWLLKHRRNPRPASFIYAMPRDSQTPWTVWSFRFDRVTRDKDDPPAMSCEIKTGGMIEIQTQHVREGTLLPERLPIKPDQSVTVKWNGRKVFDGKLDQPIVLSEEKK